MWVSRQQTCTTTKGSPNLLPCNVIPIYHLLWLSPYTNDTEHCSGTPSRMKHTTTFVRTFFLVQFLLHEVQKHYLLKGNVLNQSAAHVLWINFQYCCPKIQIKPLHLFYLRVLVPRIIHWGVLPSRNHSLASLGPRWKKWTNLYCGVKDALHHMKRGTLGCIVTLKVLKILH